MPSKNAFNKAVVKYHKKVYDQINISFPKGTRDRWKSAAESAGMTLAELVGTAVEEKIERENLGK